MNATAPLIDRFLAYLTDYRQLAPNTARGYRADLAAFAAFLVDRGRSLEKAKLVDVRHFIQSQTRAGLKASTVNREIACLRSFYRWARVWAHVNANPAGDLVRYQRQGHKLPAVLSEAEVEHFLNVKGEDFVAVRNRALFEVAHSTGCLPSELIAINVEQLERDGGILITGKGGRARWVFLGRPARRAVAEYLPVRLHRLERLAALEVPQLEDARRALFLSGRNRRLTLRSVHTLLAGRGREAFDRKKKVDGFTLRNSMAAHMLDCGAPLDGVQALLGHVHADATAKYRKIALKGATEEYMRSHPHAHEAEESEATQEKESALA